MACGLVGGVRRWAWGDRGLFAGFCAGSEGSESQEEVGGPVGSVKDRLQNGGLAFWRRQQLRVPSVDVCL